MERGPSRYRAAFEFRRRGQPRRPTHEREQFRPLLQLGQQPDCLPSAARVHAVRRWVRLFAIPRPEVDGAFGKLPPSVETSRRVPSARRGEHGGQIVAVWFSASYVGPVPGTAGPHRSATDRRQAGCDRSGSGIHPGASGLSIEFVAVENLSVTRSWIATWSAPRRVEADSGNAGGVIRIDQEDDRLGGAVTVAMIAAGFGAHMTLAGVVGHAQDLAASLPICGRSCG